MVVVGGLVEHQCQLVLVEEVACSRENLYQMNHVAPIIKYHQWKILVKSGNLDK
jgi:hypothetical protein